jgi:hypothetical protein
MGTRSFQKIVDDHAALLARLEAAKAGRPIGTIDGRRVILLQAAEGDSQCAQCVFDTVRTEDDRQRCIQGTFVSQEKAEFGQPCFKDRGFYVQA